MPAAIFGAHVHTGREALQKKKQEHAVAFVGQRVAGSQSVCRLFCWCTLRFRRRSWSLCAPQEATQTRCSPRSGPGHARAPLPPPSLHPPPPALSLQSPKLNERASPMTGHSPMNGHSPVNGHSPTASSPGHVTTEQALVVQQSLVKVLEVCAALPRPPPPHLVSGDSAPRNPQHHTQCDTCSRNNNQRRNDEQWDACAGEGETSHRQSQGIFNPERSVLEAVAPDIPLLY